MGVRCAVGDRAVTLWLHGCMAGQATEAFRLSGGSSRQEAVVCFCSWTERAGRLVLQHCLLYPIQLSEVWATVYSAPVIMALASACSQISVTWNDGDPGSAA